MSPLQTLPATRHPEPVAPCWREIFGLALDGLPFGEVRLEALLDRIERPT